MSYETFCAQFGTSPPAVKVGRRVYDDPHGLIKLARERGWDVFSAGVYLGEERRDFSPTSALIDRLAARCDRTVIVTDKAAWLFLCGRDVLMSGVTGPGEFSERALVFVRNRYGEVLGYGKVLGPHTPRLRNKVYVKHLLDKGEYLRRER
jgi:ribosome biogenesis protein Nip4